MRFGCDECYKKNTQYCPESNKGNFKTMKKVRCRAMLVDFNHAYERGWEDAIDRAIYEAENNVVFRNEEEKTRFLNGLEFIRRCIND